MVRGLMTDSIIGRERALADRLAHTALRALQKLGEYTDVTETRRGSTFDIRLEDGHVFRTTIELVRIDPRDAA